MRFLVLVSVTACAVFAQTLTLQESINKTLTHHPDLKALQLQIEQSQSGVDAVRADYLPQVNVQANYNPLQTYVFPANAQFNTIDDDGWNAGASLKQKIWDFSKTTSAIEAFQIEEDISKLSLEEQKALLAYRVKSLYELMVVQKEAIEVRKKDVEAKEAYYKQALAFVKQGLKTNADASRFLSSLYIAKESLTQSQSEFAKAKNSLSLYMGEKISDDVEL